MREGRGRMRLADGSGYEGDFKGGKRDGRGVQRAASGATFKGEFRNGLKEGLGAYRFANGMRQISLHRRDQPVGPGVRWGGDGQAVRLHDGRPQVVITIEEARKLAVEIGMPMPE